MQIYTGVSIASIDGEDNVTGVTLADGRTFPAELVIVSAGVRANTVLAKTAGIEVDRAVIVNSKMETNVPDIYACGDCAQYDGLNYAIWPEASEQGKVAGANAAGEEMEYETVPAALSFHGMRTALFAAGETVSEILFPEQPSLWRDPDRGCEPYGGDDTGTGRACTVPGVKIVRNRIKR